MTDQHTPTTDEIRKLYLLKVPHDQRDRRSAEFDRFIAAAEQRGAIKALRDAASSGLFVGPIADLLENRADQMEARND